MLKPDPDGRSIFRALMIYVPVVLLIIAFPILGYGAPPEQEPSDQPEASAQVVSEGDFHYVRGSRRDPFRSLLVLQQKQRDLSVLPPIQQVDVNQFKVVGLIIDEKVGNKAMVRTPDGKTYVIKKGDIIGKNEGDIISISLDGITIREKFLDFMKRETVVTTVLKVSEKQR